MKRSKLVKCIISVLLHLEQLDEQTIPSSEQAADGRWSAPVGREAGHTRDWSLVHRR